MSRIQETTVDAIMRWLNGFVETIQKHGVQNRNLYNMDESGFAIGTTQGACVIIHSQVRSQFQARPRHQEWVTVVECICGDGSGIDPLIIFKGANFSTEWLIPSEFTRGWHFSCTNRHWMSDIHGLKWLCRCFEPATRE